MARVLDELKCDLNFIKTHTLQPKWYKVLKSVALVGFLAGYLILFGGLNTVVFLTVFLSLSLLVHVVYRRKTDRYVKSWLDFKVVEENGILRAKSIGKYYYSAVSLNAVISLRISRILPV